MPEQTDLREVVDRLLQVPKELTGVGSWEPASHEGDVRMALPLIVEGEISDAMVTIIAYPRAPTIRFRLVLTYIRAIWRVDYTDDELHVNSANRPHDLTDWQIMGPHYHSWQDNRRFARHNSLPIKLRNARFLPNNVRTYDNAFRWFCGNTGILPPASVPELPPRDTLL